MWEELLCVKLYLIGFHIGQLLRENCTMEVLCSEMVAAIVANHSIHCQKKVNHLYKLGGGGGGGGGAICRL